MDNKSLEILVEPIFFSKFWIFRWLKKFLFLTKWPFAEKTTTLYLKIEQRSVDRLKDLRFSSATIFDREKTFSGDINIDETIPQLEKNKHYYSKSLKFYFPFPGLYWIDIRLFEIRGCEYNFRQRMLSGDEGRGNISPSDCRNPILVKDLSTRRVMFFTGILVVLTILLAIDSIPRIIQLIERLF